LEELLDDAEVRASLLTGVVPRLETFLRPFVATLQSPEQRTNAHHYIEGLLSDLDGKDIESIAYLHDRERQGLQKFIGQAEWNHRPMVTELARQIATELGEDDGVLVFDPSAFAKKGTESVGVQRQWCGRLGKVENCQVGIYLGYVSRRDHALVDFRLFLPQEWAKRKRRCEKAGICTGCSIGRNPCAAISSLVCSSRYCFPVSGSPKTPGAQMRQKRLRVRPNSLATRRQPRITLHIASTNRSKSMANSMNSVPRHFDLGGNYFSESEAQRRAVEGGHHPRTGLGQRTVEVEDRQIVPHR
jgi:hypothetical protein